MTLATGTPPVAAPTFRPARRLSQRQKAAIVVRLLRAEGVQLSLADLPEAMQVGLTKDISVMRYVDRTTLRAVVEEFLNELDSIGLAFPGGMDGALAVLDGTISTAAATRLRRQAGLGQSRDPWERLAELDAGRLVPILEDESVEIGAVMLSKLKVSKAAELLGLLPGARARRIAFAMSQTGAISPETVAKIGAALVTQLDAQAPRAFADAPVERVGAILNSSPAATRNDVLEGLDAEDAGFAEQVRRAIFTFVNIPARIDPRDVPKIIRDVDQPVLITALAAAARNETDAEAADFILANMSQRMASQLRDEMETLGKVKEKDGEAAMAAVIVAIRELEASGEILLTAEDD
jgi:flagellar motor switch protein FliG